MNMAQRARRLAALNEAALAIAGDLDLDRVLEKILKTAAKLIGARYGALGIPDGRGGFGRFLTVGISEQRADRIGALPRVHGVLGALVSKGKPIRSPRPSSASSTRHARRPTGRRSTLRRRPRTWRRYNTRPPAPLKKCATWSWLCSPRVLSATASPPRYATTSTACAGSTRRQSRPASMTAADLPRTSGWPFCASH